MTAGQAASLGSLRREYLGQDENRGARHPPLRRIARSGGAVFTLGGHRLSSLYRTPIRSPLLLIFGYFILA